MVKRDGPIKWSIAEDDDPRLSFVVNTMAVEELATQRARISIIVVLF